MSKTNTTTISVEATVNAPVDKIWQYWTGSEHITKWNSASPDWHTPKAENVVKVGGRFNIRMEAKDGSMGFDFAGTYDTVDPHKHIAYTIDDGRKVNTTFEPEGEGIKIVTTFEAETKNSIEMQRGGWQAILDSFRNYTETN